MTNYTKGRSAEYEVLDRFKASGWVVTRAAGSKGGADVWAYDPDCRTLLMIEVKVGYWPSGEEARDLSALAETVYCQTPENLTLVIILRKERRRGWRMRIPAHYEGGPVAERVAWTDAFPLGPDSAAYIDESVKGWITT